MTFLKNNYVTFREEFVLLRLFSFKHCKFGCLTGVLNTVLMWIIACSTLSSLLFMVLTTHLSFQSLLLRHFLIVN